MIYVGLSLGRCIRSILRGEVSEENVLCIITRTRCLDINSLLNVVREYHDAAGHPSYGMSEFTLEDAQGLAHRLYEQGKIHQPRLFPQHAVFDYLMLVVADSTIWLEVGPSPDTDNVAVLDAYNKYKMLAELVR